MQHRDIHDSNVMPIPSALAAIRGLDYTIVYALDMQKMRAFYSQVMGFELRRELTPQWVEYSVGTNILTLTEKSWIWKNDAETPLGSTSVHLAFRVAPGEVSTCTEELRSKGVEIVEDVRDQPWGHRTVFFRDPDGNVIEIYADI